jgi:hypothetical protein
MYKDKLWLGWIIGTWPMLFLIFGVIAYIADLPVKDGDKESWLAFCVFIVFVQIIWLSGWEKAFGSWRGAFGKKYQKNNSPK